MIPDIERIRASAVFFCHDGEGNYVLNYRANCRDENNKWDCGGEAVESGETIEHALSRGVLEEYRVPIIRFEVLGYRYIIREENGVRTHWLAHDFRALVDRSKVKNGEPHKFDEIGWFASGEIKYLVHELPSLVHSELPECIRRYSDRL